MGRVPRAHARILLQVLLAAAGLVAAAGTQRPAMGEAVPLPALRDFDGREVPLASLTGERGLVILFWASWSESSQNALRTLETLRAEVNPRGVSLAAVNVEHEHLTGEQLAELRTAARQLNVGFPMLIDDGLKLFHAYGVIGVPSTAVITPEGKLAGFIPGFSTSSREAVIDAIHGLAGTTRTFVPPPKGLPGAQRWLQLGRLALAGGRDDSARSAVERAAAVDPALADPLIELAALALDTGDLAAARQHLDRAVALEPGARGAAREQARAAALEGDASRAIALLKPIADEAQDAVACEYLGLVVQQASRSGAETAFACAVRAGGPDDAGMRLKPLAEAMRLYRRAASRRR